jgi:pimeloyl-ACP methyl ester carboxylesterase
VFIHGAATTARIWKDVLPHLADFDAMCPDRRSSWNLDEEIADLWELCAGAVVVGVSGGATLGLELAARGAAITAAVVHEPAAGSLAPGLLAHVAAALTEAGVSGFGSALYGPAWSPADASADADAVTRDFAMFSRFEPRPPATAAGPVLLTVGEKSPPIRHHSVLTLSSTFDMPWQSVRGAGHAVHLESPKAFSEIIRAHAQQSEDYP